MDLDNEFESDDSFFDDPKTSKKAPPPRKKMFEDIFGIQADSKAPSEAPSKPKVHFDLDELTNAAETSTEPTKPKASLESLKSKTPDWLGTSDDAPKSLRKLDSLDDVLSSKSDSKKSLGILDDILPQRSRKPTQTKTPSFEDILKDSKAASEQSLVQPPSVVNTILEPTLGPRRGRRSSGAGVADVLGLFSSEPENKNKETPDWLGGSSSSTVNIAPPTPVEIKQPEAPTPPPISKPTQETPQEPVNFQVNMSNLQAQESFLLVSLQLKKYEERLSEIKGQQHEILKKQEDQFEMFLSKYLEKQKGIEQEVLTQQERINDHIKAMALGGYMKAPDTLPHHSEDSDNETVTDHLVKNLKQRHQEEYFLMEESYKKQISLLEKASESLEERMSAEISNTTKLYESKLTSLKEQHSEDIQNWIEKVKVLDGSYKEELEKAKENYSRSLREAKDEFLEQIERFKEQRSRENELLSSGVDISQKLNLSLNKLEKQEEILGKLQDKVVSDYGVLSLAREQSLEVKENEIAAMRLSLEKCREQADKDRSQLLGLVRTLEQKIAEQNRNAQEERWALQQTAATVAARSAAFDREIQFSRAGLEREREQLETLKKALLAEQERVTMQLTEERLKLSAEKSRIEVSAKLVNNYEVEKVKTEAETAVQVAKELTEKLNLERSFVQKQKIELDSFRNKLLEKEKQLLEREEQVEEIRRELEQHKERDRRTVQEARHLEQRYKDRLMELQAQASSLTEREKKLTEEKLLVSKERLALYASAKPSTKKCTLCEAEANRSDPTLFRVSSTDVDAVRFRLENTAEEELNSEVSRESDISVHRSKRY